MRRFSRPCIGVVLCSLAFSSPALGDYQARILYPMISPSRSAFSHISGPPQTAQAGQVVGYEWVQGGGANPHALVWTPNGAVDLHPTRLARFVASTAYGTNGVQQVGEASTSPTYGYHAMLWSGTADSAVDLSPPQFPQFTNTYALATDGVHQVGYGQITGTDVGYRALLWTGTRESAIDLHPAGYTASFAYGTSGNQQVGYGWTAAGGTFRNFALLWNGTAQSAVDLHPVQMPGILQSMAYATDGTQQAGAGYGIGPAGNYWHALLWSGTAASAVDLNPTNLAGFTNSYAYGINGGNEAGYGFGADGVNHALLWRGTGDSAIDLQALLPPTLISSQAFTIDSSGNVFGIASDTSQFTYAVEWSPVPEPSVLWACAVALIALLGPRARTRA